MFRDGAARVAMAPAGTIAISIVERLKARGETLAVAESLTGGALAAAIVEVPGASAVFRGGVVAYAVELKHSLLGVPEELLAARGPVDPDVATALAEGARTRCGASWGLATTGVAGPDHHGGQPPGTVWLGLAGPDGIRSRRLRLAGDRTAVRAGSVAAALQLLDETLGV